MKCLKCGFENQSDVKFCEECGSLMKKESSKKTKKKLIIVILILLLLFGGVGVSYSLGYLDFLFKDNEQLVKVADVIGKDGSTAVETLEKLGLKVKVVENINEEDKDIGKVYEQTLTNQMVKKGSLVTLKVYVSDKEVKMPDVIGMSKEEAEEVLVKLGFNVALVEKESEKNNGIIIEQEATNPKKIVKGSVIKLTYSKKKEDKKEDTKDKDDKKPNKNNSSSHNNSSDNGSSNKNDSSTTNNNQTDSSNSGNSGSSSSNNGWSNWIVGLGSVDSSKYIVERKTQYSVRRKEYTTSTSELGSPWVKYKTSEESGSSAEQKIEIRSKSDMAAFEARTDIIIVNKDPQYGTLIQKYCKKINSDGTKTYYTPTTSFTCNNGGTLETYRAQCWYPAFKNKINKENLNIYDDQWFNMRIHSIDVYGWDVTYKNKTGSVKVHYYYKWGAWSEYSDNKVSGSTDLQVRTQQVYRYKKK